MKEITVIDNEPQEFPIELHRLFARLAPQDVEQFYQSYRLWSLQHDIAALQTRISELQDKIEHNTRLMESIQPSPIALSALAQLQSYGVSDTALLDRMLERGDSWLDHTVQLLVRCEELGVIRSDYTQWCENALEGAYDWITSMDQATPTPAENTTFDKNVEIAFLQKLMSEDDDTEPRLPTVKTDAISIADQDTLVPINDTGYEQRAAATQSKIDTADQPATSTATLIQHDDRDQSTTGTTEAINLEDLQVSIPLQEAVLDANAPSVVSNQATDTIKQVDAASDEQNTATETGEDATALQDKSHLHLTHALLEIAEHATATQENEPVCHIYDAPDDISYSEDIFIDSFIIVDSMPSETTNSTDHATEQAAYQEDNSETQTAITTTITAANTVTAHAVKSFARPAEQTEPTADHTTTNVYLQEDDLALPPVADTYRASGSWHNEPAAITTSTPQPRQAQQTTATHHEPTIAWSDSAELPQVSPEKRPGILIRLFRHPRNKGD